MIARRYAILPSALKDRSLEDFQFDCLVAQAGINDEEKRKTQMQKIIDANKKQKRR